MRAKYKPFLLGILFTSILWGAALYFLIPVDIQNVPGVSSGVWGHSNKQAPLWKKELSNAIVKPDLYSGETKASGSNLKLKNKHEHSKIEDLGLIRNAEDKRIREEGYKRHAFNVLVSTRLDNNRDIPDTRHEVCQENSYTDVLINASVIICFYNEDPSTLFRTVYSVLHRTPSNLLHEILLVNDSSDHDDLVDLESKFSHQNFPVKVQLLKTHRREGLIRARIFGAKKASGQVLVYLDSHCEVNKQWLEPLLNRIQENRTFVVTPIIDIINSDTFQYTASPLVRGGFNWGLHFKWDSLPDNFLKTREDFTKPIKSPTMAGGLFAIDREYFFDIGEYDAGMNIWGGENLELSFRIWMCGGRLEIIPCSRVGHVFRRRRPYGSPNGEDTMTHNSLRAAHVWMDSYIEYFYKTRPDAKQVNFGDVSPRRRLRELMKCSSFEWYLQNVYPELTIPGNESSVAVTNSRSKFRRNYNRKNYISTYQIRLSGSNLCMESEKEVTSKGSSIILKKCTSTKRQFWSTTDKGEFVLAQMLCLESPENSNEKPHLAKCHETGGLQEWKHHDDIDSPLYNMAAGLCLGTSEPAQFAALIPEKIYITMTVCVEDTASKWDLIKI